MKTTKLKYMLLVLIILIISIVFINSTKSLEKTPYYNYQIEAAQLMLVYSNKIKEYKENLNIPIYEYDIHDTGLLGEEYTMITSTLGNLPSKRTTTNPDMAALLVRMLYEGGIRPGDRVGLALTGSFPGLNIACFAACEAMDIEMVILSSMGASSYGANQYELTFPEIIDKLYKDRMISSNSALVTLGGSNDTADDIGDEYINPIIDRYKENNLNLYVENDFNKNVNHKIEVLENEGELDGFIAVGGNYTFTSLDMTNKNPGQGLLNKSINLEAFGPDKGLLNYFLNKNTSCIYLLNVQKLVNDYGMPFDPVSWEDIGSSSIYYNYEYSKGLIIFILIIIILLMIYLFKMRKNNEYKS